MYISSMSMVKNSKKKIAKLNSLFRSSQIQCGKIECPSSISMICFLHNLILSLSSALADISCSFSSRKSLKLFSSISPTCLNKLASICKYHKSTSYQILRKYDNWQTSLTSFTFKTESKTVKYFLTLIVLLSMLLLIQRASDNCISSFSFFLLNIIHLLSNFSLS